MKLSVQLFTVRDAIASDLPGTLAALRSFGLEYVETAGLAGRTVTEFGAELAKADLVVSGAHVALSELEANAPGVIAEAAQLGNKWLIVPYIPDTERDWPQVAQRLDRVGETVARAGMRLAYHNHDFELASGGFEALLAGTNPQLVSFQLDIGWAAYAGHDPARLLRDHRERIPLVHLKDLRQGDHPHVLAGEGSVDWPTVLPECSAVEFGAIEMDVPPNDPLEDVRHCTDFFRDRL